MSRLRERLRNMEEREQQATQQIRRLLKRAGYGVVPDPFDQNRIVYDLILDGLRRVEDESTSSKT